MKVGVFFGNYDKVVGGGFTISDDLIRVLMKLKSKHRFVVFTTMPTHKIKELTSDRLEFFSLRDNYFYRKVRKLNEIVGFAVKSLPVIRKRFHFKHWFHRIVCDLGIEFMWFPNPYSIEVEIPNIITIWDLAHRDQPWFPELSLNGEWYKRENRYLRKIQRASVIVTGVEAYRAQIVNFYNVAPERIKIIPFPTPKLALDAKEYNGKVDSEKVLDKYNIPPRYLFYPAQLWPHKNHVGLLLAINLLRKEHGVVMPVVFVGSDRGNRQHIRKVIDKLGLSQQVYFLGFVPRKDLVELYRNAFALTFVTFLGPDNLPPLEAFALGCPVIASNVCGAEEQLGKAALLVNPKDEKEIASAIKSLHDNPELRRTLVSRGIARASKWTAQDYLRSVSSLFDEFEPIVRCWGTEKAWHTIPPLTDEIPEV